MGLHMVWKTRLATRSEDACSPKLVHETNLRPRLVATPHRLASCVIVSGFRAALDLNTYPLRNLIRPRCAERAKPGPGKPLLIMHIGSVLDCFHAISLERSRFSEIATFFFLPL